jgi:hypothetical protein
MPTINIVRHYNIVLTRFKNAIYEDDPTWIAEWFFNNYIADNVTIEIRGNEHRTFPNPPHLSVKITYEDETSTGWLHLSQDENGVIYVQPLGEGNKFKKKYTNKKKFKKYKTLRKKI